MPAGMKRRSGFPVFFVCRADKAIMFFEKRRVCFFNIVRIFANNINGLMMEEKIYPDAEEQLARFAKAMGHPARIAILRFLAERDECFFGDIHQVLPISKATVSQHLKELKEAGLIQGEILPPKVKYCIHRENWALARAAFSDFFCACARKKSCCD